MRRSRPADHRRPTADPLQVSRDPSRAATHRRIPRPGERRAETHRRPVDQFRYSIRGNITSVRPAEALKLIPTGRPRRSPDATIGSAQQATTARRCRGAAEISTRWTVRSSDRSSNRVTSFSPSRSSSTIVDTDDSRSKMARRLTTSEMLFRPRNHTTAGDRSTRTAMNRARHADMMRVAAVGASASGNTPRDVLGKRTGAGPQFDLTQRNVA
jgi:hypothetical protein